MVVPTGRWSVRQRRAALGMLLVASFVLMVFGWNKSVQNVGSVLAAFLSCLAVVLVVAVVTGHFKLWLQCAARLVVSVVIAALGFVVLKWKYDGITVDELSAWSGYFYTLKWVGGFSAFIALFALMDAFSPLNTRQKERESKDG